MSEQIPLSLSYQVFFSDDLTKNKTPKEEHDIDSEFHIGNYIWVEERKQALESMDEYQDTLVWST